MDFLPRLIFLAPKTKIDQEKDTLPSFDRKEFWNRTYPRIPVLIDEIKNTDCLMQKIKNRNAELSAELRVLRNNRSKILLRKSKIIKYRNHWFDRMSSNAQVERMMTSKDTEVGKKLLALKNNDENMAKSLEYILCSPYRKSLCRLIYDLFIHSICDHN